MKLRNSGFTLIELLVVIAIIALLSSAVIASLSTARMKARDAKRITDLRQIKIALEMFYDANGFYPGTYNGWDTNSYRASYVKGVNTGTFTSWSLLENDLKPYIFPLPVDPINSNCNPSTNGCYSYIYGNVGRNTYKATYDLWAQLETPDHPSSCKYQKYRWGSGIYGTTLSKGICAESGAPFNGTYSSQSYYVSNDVN